MNIEGGSYSQEISDALDTLKLTAGNREIGQQYLDMSQAEAPGLLQSVSNQDYSMLTDMERQQCREAIMRIWDTGELVSRFIRFAGTVGGASACYALGMENPGWIINRLDKVHRTACRGELYAHHADAFSLNKLSVLYDVGRKDPEALLQAMGLCRCQDGAAQMLLAGVYLYCVPPGPDTEGAVQRLREFLEQAITDHLGELLGGPACSDAQLAAFRAFLTDSDPDGAFPAELTAMLRGKQTGRELFVRLAGCAWLALDHDRFFGAFLRLASALDMESGRPSLPGLFRYMTEQEWFYRHTKFLLEKLSISPQTWIEWSLREREDTVWLLMVKKYPEAVRQVAGALPVREYERLLEKVQKGNRQLYEEIRQGFAQDYKGKLADELLTNYPSGKNEARQYLLGEAEFDRIEPFIKAWQKSGCSYGNKHNRLKALRDDKENASLYRRGVVLEGLLLDGSYFIRYMFVPPSLYWYTSGRDHVYLTAEELESVLDIFEQEQVPVFYRLAMLSGLHESCYSHRSEKDQEAMSGECVAALDRRIDRWGGAYGEAALMGPVMTRIFCIRVMNLHAGQYKEPLLACAGDSSKQVQEELLALYAAHKEWESEFVTMLRAGKQKERLMAARVLEQWGADGYRQELEQALEREKNQKLQAYFRQLVCVQEKDRRMDEIVTELLKGNRRQKILWAFEQPYEKLHKRDGTEVSEEYLQAILVCHADMDVPGIHKDAARLAAELDGQELAACMGELFQRWMGLGGETKRKWALYAAAIHGGEEIVPLIYREIKEWPAKSRGAIAAEAVKALTLNGSSAALLLVDQLSRKFKYRQVRRAAMEAMDSAAQELNISREELEDRIVPDLGFDQQGERVFDYGTRTFTVRLVPALQTEVYDGTGKRLKNMPTPGVHDDPEKAQEANRAYKSMKKQLKTVIENQKQRFIQMLSGGRLWNTDDWKRLFVNNPVMHQFASGLIWGIYEENTAQTDTTVLGSKESCPVENNVFRGTSPLLKKSFRYMEDGSFNTAKEEVFSLPEKGVVGLVHPLELSEEELAVWREQLADYEVAQPVCQLERCVYGLKEEEENGFVLTRFQGKRFSRLTLFGRLERAGWLKGTPIDGGEIRSFYREDGAVGAMVEFSACSMEHGDRIEEIGEVFFYRTGPADDMGKRRQRCRPGEITPRYFSETVLQLAEVMKD
jgi:hypothetical protein